MAGRLFVAKPLSETLGTHITEWNQNTTIFIQENEFENVICKISTILSRSNMLALVWTMYKATQHSKDQKFISKEWFN